MKDNNKRVENIQCYDLVKQFISYLLKDKKSYFCYPKLKLQID